jgi:hypothetical protein
MPTVGLDTQGYVVDLGDSKLSPGELLQVQTMIASSLSTATMPWSNITSTPTTMSGYVAPVFTATSRALNTAFQLSTARLGYVTYAVDIAATLSLTAGATGTVFLEAAADSGFTTAVREVARSVNGNTGTLTVGLGLTQNVTAIVSGYISANEWVRIRTANTVGTPVFTYRNGQEVLI